MPAYNKIILIGNITKDIELKQTQSGIEVVRFSIAVNKRSAKDAENKADFFNVTAWGKTATFVSQWFKKGDPILLDGSIHNTKYTDASGQTRFSMEVTADTVSFVSIKGEESLRGAVSDFGGAGAESPAPSAPKMETVEITDDLPF